MKYLALAGAVLLSACLTVTPPDAAKEVSPGVFLNIENHRTSHADNWVCVKYANGGWEIIDMDECHKNGVK